MAHWEEDFSRRWRRIFKVLGLLWKFEHSLPLVLKCGCRALKFLNNVYLVQKFQDSGTASLGTSHGVELYFSILSSCFECPVFLRAPQSLCFAGQMTRTRSEHSDWRDIVYTACSHALLPQHLTPSASLVSSSRKLWKFQGVLATTWCIQGSEQRGADWCPSSLDVHMDSHSHSQGAVSNSKRKQEALRVHHCCLYYSGERYHGGTSLKREGRGENYMKQVKPMRGERHQWG